jgi:hypothetical protein
MALDFTGATSDRVTVSTSSELQDISSVTVAAWVYLDSAPGGNVFITEHVASGGVFRIRLRVGSDLQTDFWLARASTQCSLESSTSALTAQWSFIAATFEESTDSGEIYQGDLDTAAAEVSYSVNNIGSGVTSTADGQLVIGNRVTSNVAWNGKIAFFTWISEYLSLEEIINIQYSTTRSTRPASTTGIFMHLGVHGSGGVGTQQDWSGNGNNGTITGAAKSAHAPIQIFPRWRNLLTPPATLDTGLSVNISPSADYVQIA